MNFKLLICFLVIILPLIGKAGEPAFYDFYKESNGVRLYYEYNNNSDGTVGAGVVGFKYYITPEPNSLVIPSSVEVWNNYYQRKFTYKVNCVWGLNNGNFKSVTLPPTLEKIGRLAFASCGELSSITIPESVMEIGEDAFKNCNKLETVNFEAINCKRLTSYRKSFFNECPSLKNIYIGDNVEYIEAYAFYNCSTIENLCIGKSVNEIENYSFSGCPSLKNVNFNAIYCNTVGTNSFMYSKNIEKISFGANVKLIPGNIFNGLHSLKEIKIPDNIIEIGEGAFKKCTAIKNITLGGSVKIIGPNAFASCSALESVDLKYASIDSVGQCAFLGCTSLSKIQGSCVTADRRGIVLNGKLVAFAPAGITEYVIPNEIVMTATARQRE